MAYVLSQVRKHELNYLTCYLELSIVEYGDVVYLDVKVISRRITSVGVSSKHQQVNLYYCTFGPDGVLKRHKVYTGLAECPYVQFVAAARVICTKKFVVGDTNG